MFTIMVACGSLIEAVAGCVNGSDYDSATSRDNTAMTLAENSG